MMAELIRLLIVVLCAVGLVSYHRFPRLAWIPLLGGLLVILTFFSLFSWFSLVVLWALYLAPVICLLVTPLRMKLLTQPIFHLFKQSLPNMSDTERDALEAGDVWWDGDLLRGNPNWKKLLSFPKPTLTAEEQRFLSNQAEKLCALLDDWKIVHEDHDLSPEVWEYIKKERFWGMVIPKEYGGLGFSALAHSAVVAKIATRSVSAAVSVMVPNSLGPAELLLHYGTESQKQQYLSALASGREIPCFALTGPEAGSDAAAMPDTGIVCKGKYEGREVIGLRLNWNKRYITLAPIATVLGLAVKVFDPDGLLGKKYNVGITLCLIPTTHPGVEIGQRHYPLGMAFMNGPTRGRDVFIPLDWVIGGREKLGQGWRMLMECLSIGRSISLPAISAASGQLAFRTASAYARIRRQFKVSIGQFEGIETMLAQIAGMAYSIEATRGLTASAVTQGIKPAVPSAIAKYHTTEMARQIVNAAMDIHGGKGIQLGPMNYLAHAYISLPIGITVEGANVLTRCLIILGQGAIRSHPYVFEEMMAAKDPDERIGLRHFDKLFFSHIGYVLSNFVRTFFLSITGGRCQFTQMGHPMKRYYHQLTRMSAALALVVDIAMLILGGKLKRKENLSARLGDVLSHLYLASAVLKYFEDQRCPNVDEPYVRWCLTYHLHQMQSAFDDFMDNFPSRMVGFLLKRLLFPWGRAYKKPGDRLAHRIAQHMMTPSTFRERMTNAVFLGDERKDPLARMEQAFIKVDLAEQATKKLQRAIKNGELPKQKSFADQIKLASQSGLLTSEEVEHLYALEEAQNMVIQVDDFPFDFFLTAHQREKIRHIA